MPITVRRILAIICIVLGFAFYANAEEISISANGLLLKAYYDSTDVENLWLKGMRVDWKTGIAIRKANNPKTTHCSAFVAATLLKKNIYIARPPEYKRKNLANNQYDYLESAKAIRDGWVETINNIKDVQAKANDGFFVVAVTRNYNRSGHIALIYPSHVKEDDLIKNGPMLIQAGSKNKIGITLKKGFRNHYKNFSDLKVRYYYNGNIIEKSS